MSKLIDKIKIEKKFNRNGWIFLLKRNNVRKFKIKLIILMMFQIVNKLKKQKKHITL